MQSQLSEILIRYFDENKRDYFSISELKTGLSKPLSSLFNINIQTATQKVISDLLKSNISPKFSLRKKGNSIFLTKFQITNIDLHYIRNHPKFTADQVFAKIPLNKEEFVSVLNNYMKAGLIEISIISQTKKFGFKIIPINTINEQNPSVTPEITDEAEIIKKVYFDICRGKSYVKIYELRRFLNWSEEKFDTAIQKLWEEGIIELQASSHNLLNLEEQKDSYLDKNNVLRVLLLWRKQ